VEIPESYITIYLQNTETQESYTYSAQADKLGEWFYRHDTFLPSGNYVVWVQGKIQGLTSAPSGQKELTVTRQALQLAGSRLSYELMYLALLIIFVLVSVGLVLYVFYHFRSARRKHKLLAGEIKQAEESIKRGFAVLKRDIEAELLALKSGKGKDDPESIRREQQLLQDLQNIEERLEKEIWEIEEQEALL
jgi:hypothetical protein